MNFSTNQSGKFEKHGLLEELNTAEFHRLFHTLIFMVVILVVGASGNGLVLYIKCTGVHFNGRTSHNWFIFFLACLDIFFCLVIIPTQIYSLTLEFTFTNPHWCKFARFLSLASNIVLGITLFIMAVDRFLAICEPFEWRINYNKARNSSLLAVILSCGMALPVIKVYRINEYKLPGYDVIASECDYGNTSGDRAFVIFGMVIFGLSFVLVCILYCFIGRGLIQLIRQEMQSRRLYSLESEAEAKARELDPAILSKEYKMRAKAIKATCIMFLVTSSVAVGYFPSLALILARSLKSDFSESLTNTERGVYKFFVRFYYVTYAINPFIYCMRDLKFRRVSKDVLLTLFGKICQIGNSSERQ